MLNMYPIYPNLTGLRKQWITRLDTTEYGADQCLHIICHSVLFDTLSGSPVGLLKFQDKCGKVLKCLNT